MALVNQLEAVQLAIDAKHTTAAATYSIIRAEDGRKYLQIDTYGSPTRELKGKKSQSLRLSASAVKQLADIIRREF